MATGLVARFRLAFTPGSQQQLEQEARQAGKKTATAYEQGASALEGFFKKITNWLTAAFAIHKVIQFAESSIKAANESETAWNELGLTLGKVGVRIDDVRGQLERLGKQFLDKTTFGDEAALRGLNSLVQITGDYNLSLRAVQVSADLAAAKHLSLEDASVLVGRALEGNTIQLKRMGVEIKNGLPLLGQLETMFGGAAQNELTTYGGKLKQVGQFWQEFKEEIGKALVSAGGGTSVLDTMIGTLKGLATWVKQNAEQLRLFGNAVVTAADYLLRRLVPALETAGLTLRTKFSSFLANTTNELIAFLHVLNFIENALRPSFQKTFFDVQIEKLEAFAKSMREAGATAQESLRLFGLPGGQGPGASLRGGGSRPSVGAGPDFSASIADRIAGDAEAQAKARAAWKKMLDDMKADYEAAIRDAGDATLGLNAELDADFKAKSTARLLAIRTEGAARKAALDDLALGILAIAGQEAEENQKERDRLDEEAKLRHQHFVEHWHDLADTAFQVSDLAAQILEAGDAWGIFGGKAGETFGGILQGISQVASSVGELAMGIASGNPLAIIEGGLGVIQTIGGFFHENKDAGRTAANAQWYAAAMAGDEGALQELLDHSDPASGKGWATKLARDDAAAKYHGAKVHFDQEAAQAAARGAAAPTTSLVSAITPEQILRDQADQAREKERQIRANEEEGIRLRDLAEQQTEQAKLSQDAKGLSEELQRMVASAIQAQRQAELLGETGPLGFDSPLFRDAETRANRAFDEAQRAVAEALGKQAEASAPGSNVEAGFTVQRTLTEVSAGRIVGELTSQTIWLEKIYNAVSGRTVWPLPGMNGGTGNIVLNLDGQEVARVVGAHQAGDYQLHASLAGSSNLPSV